MRIELTDGRRFRALTVINLFTRECLAIDVGRALGGHDVARTLERLRFERGVPQRIYCDNGTEFVSAAMDLWAYANGVALDFSRHGEADRQRHDRIIQRPAAKYLQRPLVRVTGGRALAPTGRFYFVEHGLAEEPEVERWQHRLNAINQRLLGGCNLTRPIARLIEQAGFEIERLEKSYMKDAPKFAGFVYRGVAKRIP